MNPYASESANRFAVKSQPKPKPQEDDGKIDHPLFEGKKLDMSKQELKAFTKAMEHEEFKTILNDYIKEISDPGNKKEYETYLRQLEDAGDLPVGTKLIQPIQCFCIKTMSKKMTSDINKQYFDQKTFINICMHEHIQKPQRTFVTMPSGQSGYNWQLPYSVSKARHDQDKGGTLCATYDVVFSRDIGDFIQNPDFKKFVADTAIDGINRVLAEHKEKASSDYKILKNLICKGGEPGLMTVKIEIDNKLLANADVSKHETQLQKEVTTQNDQHKNIEEQIKKESAEAGTKPLAEIDEEDHEEEEPMPTSVVQPKYKVVYSYPVLLEDHWEGHATTELLEKNPQMKIPKELTVTISVPHVESLKLAHLDINDTSLVFEYPKLYYLDLNLKYNCDAQKGSAKHDKVKKTLTIRVPVKGLTEDSQKVWEEQMKTWQASREKRSFQEEAARGEAQAVIMMDGLDEAIKDDYGLVEDTQEKLNQDNDTEKQRADEVTQQRENFLKVYKEDKESLNPKPLEEDLAPSEIKFKPNLADSESDLNLQTSIEADPNRKPLIQEISSTSAPATATQTTNSSPSKISNSEEEQVKFNWENAQRIDANFTFLHQTEYVFVNLLVKGYNKLTDVRFALSMDELWLEVRNPSDNKVHKVAKTLFQQIDVDASSIELLVDYVVVKMKKNKDSKWDQLGYDITQFQVPNKKGQKLKSNFLKMDLPKEDVVVVKEEAKLAPITLENENKENQDANSQQETNEDVRKEENERVKGKTLCYMNLESSIIYKIY